MEQEQQTRVVNVPKKGAALSDVLRDWNVNVESEVLSKCHHRKWTTFHFRGPMIVEGYDQGKAVQVERQAQVTFSARRNRKTMAVESSQAMLEWVVDEADQKT